MYSRPARAIAAACVAISRGCLPPLLALVVVATDPPIELPILLQLLAVLAVLPALLAWLLRRAAAARVELLDDCLALRRSDLRVDLPFQAIARITPWWIPLPSPGLTFWLRSGRRLSYGLAVDDPADLLRALAPHIGGAAAAALAHPIVHFAGAAAPTRRRRWYHIAGKFPLFALLPTAVLFNAHQFIAYGGPLGEYYLFGAAAFVRTFAVYWLTVTIYLVLFAACWRAAAEAIALLTACAAPSHAARGRRIAEVGARIGYYAGVPLLLAARFFT